MALENRKGLMVQEEEHREEEDLWEMLNPLRAAALLSGYVVGRRELFRAARSFEVINTHYLAKAQTSLAVDRTLTTALN